ncbi:hypothetical protein EOA27_34240 [Mesorhizobium sp. M2A.F.Ca.ET.037.01.1.1]|nr:hypothetical protein EJ072_34765 [Mesorhizobium sp. M2A.F.Ca.ET.046.03.2.1]RUX00591.1 hypothetical protein EOA27_34240 [Mesorhizobium sp. M2A.F.Ca.ET.037.01.1.1]RUX98983.1 hypothetical protein EOA25_26820 [Mesorhizobium sp. M2A.F.Ca.ET.040.01.1.1]RVC71554.1 hypothetical protein EN766_26500 [Mesorhizobium sp. M2A.F.Ca.ET.046.02.1.1]RWA78681.1 MAG: hypothetical protein EOQ31_34890 [Mesorhizobium sp.]RWX67183.1 hypothetical protein EOA24_16660 [Mesorhizobium sp. M2A.F.Ca.ET.039.01.1.1]
MAATVAAFVVAIVILALVIAVLVAFMRAGGGPVAAMPGVVILCGLVVVANAGCVDLVIVGCRRRRQPAAIIRASMG